MYVCVYMWMRHIDESVGFKVFRLFNTKVSPLIKQ